MVTLRLRKKVTRMRGNDTDISIKRIESRTFFVMGNQSIEVKDYKIISSGNGDTELMLVLKGNASIFEMSASL